MIVPIASLPHYRAHLEPVLALVPHAPTRRSADDVALVASHRDVRAARRAGFSRIVRMHHGIGQSYGGDHPSYPGGRDHHDVGLFLVPNEHAADRWRRAYPQASVAIVGSPILDGLPGRDGGGVPPVVAIAFHWECGVAPETHSARHEYRAVLAGLTDHYRVIGHGHSRIPNLGRFWRERGIEYVPDFREVCRRADVLVADNTSALYEFASTGRAVVVVNSRRYRRHVHHGLRFWDAAHVGPSIDRPDMLRAGIMAALAETAEDRARREDALSIVYGHRTGGAERAAGVLLDWIGQPARARRPVGTITVGMPYRGVPHLVGKAVRSVLAQSHRDLRLFVIGDGEAPSDLPSDPRLTVHVLARQHGAYFAHAVALAASPDAFYAPHDADDWSEREHLARLAEVERSTGAGAVVSGVIWRHQGKSRRPLRMRCWMGLYATERLRAVGGFDPGSLVAQDSLLVALLDLSGRVAVTSKATYHQVRRADSLTQAEATGLRSPLRTGVRAGNALLLEAVTGRTAEQIGSYRRRRMSRTMLAEVEREAALLRAKLGQEVAA